MTRMNTDTWFYLLKWLKCFLRICFFLEQFYRCVGKVDYLALRNGFITASFVVFPLLNVNGWHAMFWASLIPIVT
ncbi:Mlo-related protein [Vigna unguiculata]|uniref:Mlo-related protein n=1 Tax=Vigna unguiculata TaxID=3917 RepID=A0A4D6L3Q4_VIGUN|nr:Mlo-related protein [Vigna unguiculata]